MKAIIKYSLVWGATFISICGLTVGMAKPVVGEIQPAVRSLEDIPPFTTATVIPNASRKLRMFK